MKNRIRLTESQLHRVIKESVNKILKESTININQNKVNKLKMLIARCGGSIEPFDEDMEDLIIYDGEFPSDGDGHRVESMNLYGVEMDDGDFYEYDELTPSDVDMLIDYAEWFAV